jgi:indole-3-glycerol phosphate synthase
MTRLDQILETTRESVAKRKLAVPQAELASRLTPKRPDRRFAEALSKPGLSLIAEHKRSSPSAGVIREDLEILDVTSAYEAGGASALSVLTEESWFGGSLDDVRSVRASTDLPILRKDFTVDSYQLLEAAEAGADAVLLIVAALELAQLQEFEAEAFSLGLDVLIEVHDEHELEAALQMESPLIGINNRNLKDFTVDIERTFELLPDIPAGKTVVSESGIREPAQVERLDRVGIDAVLVGESLMRADDLQAAVVDLLSRT